MAAVINKKKEKEKIRTQEFFLRKLIRGGSIFFFGVIISKILTYIYRIIVARVDPQSYGQFSIGFALAGILGVMTFLGLDLGVGRFIPFYLGKKNKKKLATALSIGFYIPLLISIVLGLALYLSSGLLSKYIFHSKELAPILILFAMSLPILTANRYFVLALSAFQDSKYVSMIKYVFENLSKVIITLFLIRIWRDAYGITIAFIISVLATTLILTYVFNKHFFKIKEFSIKDKKTTSLMFSYSIPLLFAGVLDMIIEWTDTLMLSYYKTEDLVGIYNAAVPTAYLLIMIPQSLLFLFLPVVTQLYAKRDISSIRFLYKNMSRWVYFLNFPLFLAMMIFSKKIITLLFGQNYASAGTPLIALSIGFFIFSMSLKDISLIRMLQNSKIIFFISVLSALSNVILNSLLIPIFSITGAAIATAISFILMSFLYIIMAYKKFKTTPVSLDYIKATISAIISIFLAYKIDYYLFKVTTKYIILFDIIIAFIIYFLILYALKAFNQEDKNLFSSIRKKLGV